MRQKHGPYEKAKTVFLKQGGMLRTKEAIRAGIHPRTLYAMRDDGVIEKLSRGLYRLADLPPLGDPDLVSVARRVPGGVICLISALAFHGLTTQVPHEVYLAVSRDSEPPRIDYPPVRVFRFSDNVFAQGIQEPTVDGIALRIYSPEKTLADCFKYRNKIGLDVALEALRLYLGTKRPKVDLLMEFARICRVGKIMQSYLEALL
jgi:predicted transcriptional regulator of viral defense system